MIDRGSVGAAPGAGARSRARTRRRFYPPLVPAPAARPSGLLRVGHAILGARAGIETLASRLDSAEWDMVELDVLRHDGRLVVAHDAGDLARPGLIGFEEALRALVDHVAPQVRIDVDMKTTGYEAEVAAAIAAAGIEERTLVST